MRREVREPPDPPPGYTAADPREWLRAWLRVQADPSVKVTGFALAAVADYKTGANIHPGNELLMKLTGLKSDKSIRDALKLMRDWGMIWRYLEGSKAPFIITRKGRVRPSDEYRLTFPPDVTVIPMLSPDLEEGWEWDFLILWITPERR